MIVKKYLHPLKVRQIDTLILGCTHYPILKNTIQNKIGKNVLIIDSAIAVADKICTYLSEHPEIENQISKTNQCEFFVSDVTEQFEKTAKIALNRSIKLKHIQM